MLEDGDESGLQTTAAFTMPVFLSCSAQLNLSMNQIGPAGAAELAKSLAANVALTRVCCHSARYQNDGWGTEWLCVAAEARGRNTRVGCLHSPRAYSLARRSSSSVATTGLAMEALWS